MNYREWLALAVVGLIVIGVPGAALGYQHWLRPETSAHQVIDIKASAPEKGGFSPDAIRVPMNEPVTLRFTSMDVTHGISIGPGLGVEMGHLDPGTVKEITLTFDHPGTYTYYCNTWCSTDHWRMRGVIEVYDPAHPDLILPAQPDPIIAGLIAEGVDIDAELPESAVHSFERQPSAERAPAIIDSLDIPAELTNSDWQHSHTPMQAVERLAEQNPAAAETDLLDVAAYLWTQNSSPESLVQAEQLYNQNCAACHGQYGGGDGPAADTTAKEPIAFADAGYMFERRGDVLYAKIRRGGMGTGMPNFGTLFTPEETWAFVDYLWTLSATQH